MRAAIFPNDFSSTVRGHPDGPGIPISGSAFEMRMSENPADMLALMQSVVDRYAYLEPVRQAIYQILRESGAVTARSRMKAIANFVRENVRYVPDPVDAERVERPTDMLADIWQHGQAMGDCDDHTILLSVLFTGAGIRNQMLAVKLNADYFNHVINSALVDSEWIDIDVCFKTGAMPDYRERMVL